LLLLGGLGKSKGELRRLIAQGGITINGNRVENADLCISQGQLADGVKIRKGKKTYRRFLLGAFPKV
jgi:tyrosyl-tRNA synthetase